MFNQVCPMSAHISSLYFLNASTSSILLHTTLNSVRFNTRSGIPGPQHFMHVALSAPTKSSPEKLWKCLQLYSSRRMSNWRWWNMCIFGKTNQENTFRDAAWFEAAMKLWMAVIPAKCKSNPCSGERYWGSLSHKFCHSPKDTLGYGLPHQEIRYPQMLATRMHMDILNWGSYCALCVCGF